MPILAQLALMAMAAVLEVGGDALIRKGLTTSGALLVVAGFVVLGSYGIVVNLVRLDFSRMLGAYVGWFALVSVLAGWLVFGDRISTGTWMGLGLVVAGSLVIHLAH